MSKPITVAELIAQLQVLPQELPVLTEGCDCEGPCAGARLDAMRALPKDAAEYVKIPYVLLVRDDTLEMP